MNRLTITLIFLTALHSVNGQSKRSVSLTFSPVWKQELVKADQPLINGTDTIEFRAIKFYVSNIELYQNDQQVFVERNSYHLVNCLENNHSIYLTIPEKIDFNKIRFHIGIDSTTHSLSKMDGELNPLNGMYWTWQSGYIHIKLEGAVRSLFGPGEFRYHLGGYRHLHDCIQTIERNISNQNKIDFQLDMLQLFQDLPWKEFPNIMSPGKNAMDLSRRFSSALKMIQ